MTSRKYYEMELQKLNASLLEMGEMIRMAIGGAVTALLEFDHDKAREIIAYDEQIDRQNREIEQQCYTLLLSQQPVAGDLRQISAALKMITDMERIGDQASDIADITKYLENSELTQHVHIQQMAEAAMGMLTDSIEAFVKKDLLLARKVMKQDDVVDELFNQVKSELITAIAEEPDQGEICIDMVMVAKYFERIADHVVNIAEWVEYSVTGEHKAHE